MKEYQNYIFDLYGTLIDIETNEKKAYLWKKMALWYQLKGALFTPAELKGHFHRYRAIAQNAAGTDGEYVIETIFAKLFSDRGIKLSDIEIVDTAILFRCLSIEHIALYPGVIELIKQLKENGKKCYLLSNAQRCMTEPELVSVGLDFCFDGILLSSDLQLRKPCTDVFDILCSKYKLKKEDTLMVGNDDVEDCQGACKAGISSCYIQTLQSPEQRSELPYNCRKISKLAELLDWTQ